MGNFKKMLGVIAASVIASSMMCTSVFAEDFVLDTSSAKQTYGGGQSFTTFTRLDNEKRDKNKFNPLWIKEETTIEISFTTEGEYETTPINLIFQSWKGDLVSSNEDRWVQIPPTELTESHAVFTYEGIVSHWGENFSDVYAINVGDGGDNSLFVNSIVIKNCDIPDDEIPTLKGGTVLGEDGMPITFEETAPAEQVTEQSIAQENSETVVSESTDVELPLETGGATPLTTTSSEVTGEVEGNSNTVYIICIVAGSVVIVGLVILLIVMHFKHKNRGWH